MAPFGLQTRCVGGRVLGYRTLFTADQGVVGRDLMDEARAQLHSWLRASPRGFDTDQMDDGVTIFPNGARAMQVRRRAKDGSDTLRFRLSEPRPEGLWTTRLTVRSAPSERSWALVEVEDPSTRDEGFGKRQRVAPPGLARNLLDAVDAEDGPLLLRSTPYRFGGDRLSQLLDLVESPERRALLVLAATPTSGSGPNWDPVPAMTAKASAGQASVLLVPPDLVEEWNSVVEDQRLPSGGLRLFYPGTLLGEPSHAQRNLYFTPDRIEERGAARVSTRIGWLARENATRLPLPAAVRRLERVLDDFESETVISVWTARSEQRRRQVREKRSEASLEAGRPSALPRPSAAVVDALPWPIEDLVAAKPLITQVVGEDWSIAQAIEYLVLLNADYQQQIEQSQGITDELRSLSANLREDLARAELEREAAQDEALQVESRLLEAEDRIRYLQQELIRHSAYDAAYGVVPDSLKTHIPEDFDGILDALATFECVKFVGDPEKVRELNDLDGRVNAVQKAYAALLALEDYARAKRSGDFEGSVSTYLKNTPNGYRGWYGNRHADFESADVGNQDRYRAPRTFWVEDLQREIYMDCHFKITQEDQRSPRLHYFDATTQTGLIYVGYLGPHLPTKRTN
jgi:hypothetical protein